jgi:hypothetical protein
LQGFREVAQDLHRANTKEKGHIMPAPIIIAVLVRVGVAVAARYAARQAVRYTVAQGWGHLMTALRFSGMAVRNVSSRMVSVRWKDGVEYTIKLLKDGSQITIRSKNASGEIPKDLLKYLDDVFESIGKPGGPNIRPWLDRLKPGQVGKGEVW